MKKNILGFLEVLESVCISAVPEMVELILFLLGVCTYILHRCPVNMNLIT
jgi:hypothetical protein